MPDTGFSAGCEKGTIVAMSPAGTDTAGLYIPAEAIWSDSVRSDGSWIPSYKAYALGIVATDIVNEGATIICNGWSADAELIGLLAPDGVVGDYYLTRNGIATPGDDVTREMRVYCYSYLPSGKLFIKPALPEYAGHAHNYVDIPANAWVPSNGSSGSSAESTEGIPSSAYAYVYTDPDTIPELFAAVSSNPQYPCLVKNGTEVSLENWGIAYDQEEDSNGVLQTVGAWVYINFALEQSDVFSLHTITPLLANEPLVRSVSATPANKLLRITNAGGKVFVDINNTPIETDVYSGVGINSLTSAGIKTGPVVQGLKAGPGIQLSNYVDSATHSVVHGVQVITATQFAGTMVDMNVCNLDRVVMGTSFNGISYVFPQGATSTLIGTMRVPHFDADGSVPGSLVFVFQGNGGSIGNLTATVIVQATPGDSAVPVASPINYTVTGIGSTNEGYCYKSMVSLGTSLQSDALVVLKLTSTGASAITLVSASLVLQ